MGRGGAEQRLPAHKFVLSVGSAVFDAMFNSTLATQVGMLKGQCHEMNYFFDGRRFLNFFAAARLKFEEGYWRYFHYY